MLTPEMGPVCGPDLSWSAPCNIPEGQSSRGGVLAPSHRSLFPPRVLGIKSGAAGQPGMGQRSLSGPPVAWSSSPGFWGLARPGPALMRVSPLGWGALQADAHTQFPERGRFLQLQALSTADSGNYSCTAHNAAGSTSVAFRVEIHSEWAPPCPPAHPPLSDGLPAPTPLCPSPAVPTIRPGPPTVNASVNQTALLPCQVDGAPPPLVSWRKDGAPLDPGSPRWELEGQGTGRVSGDSAGCKQKPTWAVGAERWLHHQDTGLLRTQGQACLLIKGVESPGAVCPSVWF